MISHAFPCENGSFNKGMELRDYFAAKIVPTLIATLIDMSYGNLANIPENDDESAVRFVAKHAYLIADAMIAERKKND